MITAFAVAAALSATDPLLLSDFDGPAPRLNWITVNDNVMGGRSEGGPEFADGVLTFSGFVNTNGGGFSSIRALNPDHNAWDLSSYNAFRLRVRGDERTYRITVRTAERFRRDRVTYGAEFEAIDRYEWSEVTIPFAALSASWRGNDISSRVAPFDPSLITEIGLSISDGVHGPFEMKVDRLEAVFVEEPKDEYDARLDALIEKLH